MFPITENTASVSVDGPSGVMLFSYDNNTFVIVSSLLYNERFRVKVPDGTKEIVNLSNKRTFSVPGDGVIDVVLEPSVYYVFECRK